MSDLTAEQIAASSGGFLGLIGLKVGIDDHDRVTGTLEITPDHHQPYGLVHGGVYCAMIETLASFAAARVTMAGDGNPVVGLSNATDFLRATREGILDAIAEPVHVGRTQHLWSVVVTRRSDGKPVARGQVRMQVLPTEGDLAGAPMPDRPDHG